MSSEARNQWTKKLTPNKSNTVHVNDLKSNPKKSDVPKKDYAYKPEYIADLKLRFAYDDVAKILTLFINGRFPSLNFFYSCTWIDRKKLVDAYHKRLAATMFYLQREKGNIPPFERIKVEIEYNSALDVDNVILASKFNVDFIRFAKLLKDDAKKFYRGVNIIPNEALEHNQYVVRIINIH